MTQDTPNAPEPPDWRAASGDAADVDQNPGRTRVELLARQVLAASTGLGRARERCAEAAAQAPTGLCAIGGDGFVLDATRATATLLRTDMASLLGRSLIDLVCPDDRPIHAAAIDLLRERGGQNAWVARFHRADGTEVWLQAIGEAEPGGAVVRVILSDITERRREEAVLARANRALAITGACVEALVRASSEQVLLQDVCAALMVHGGYARVCALAPGDAGVRTPEPGTAGEQGAGSPEAVALATSAPCRALPGDAGAPASGWRLEAARHGWRAALALPLQVDGAAAAVLSLRAAGEDAFDDDEMCLLGELASDLAYGIQALRDRARRERAEEARRALDERHRAILESAMDGFVLLDTAGRILDANEAYARMCGYSTAELLGMRISQLQAQLDERGVAERIRQVMEHGEARFETRHLRRDGTPFDVEVSVRYRSRDDGYLAAFVRDITGRKRAEAERLEGLERHRTILQSAMDGFWVTDARGRLVEVNDAYCRMSGYARSELIGKPISELDVLDSEAAVAARIERIHAHGGDRFETQHRRSDGTVFDAEVSVQFSALGEAYFAVFVRDISERNRAQQERDRLEAQLAQAQRMETVGRLAGGIARDFNNMMLVVLGHSDLALMREGLDAGLRGELLEIQRAADRSAALTQQLLAFARRQTGAPRAIDLEQAIPAMWARLGAAAGDRVTLEWEPCAAGWPVRIDPAHLEQVLTHLCANARDAIEGAGTVRITTRRCVLRTPRASTDGDIARGSYMRVSVRDTGCGIPQSTLEHLFEPFFTTRPADQGTGLGLATVYGLVKQNGGYVDVSSQPGRGATFHVYLPRCAPDAQARSLVR